MRILDLARNLLRLSGRPYRPGENVIITGLRPGEKLHEELSAPDEKARATRVDRVSVLETVQGFADLPFEVIQALKEGDTGVLVDFLLSNAPAVSRTAQGVDALRA